MKQNKNAVLGYANVANSKKQTVDIAVCGVKGKTVQRVRGEIDLEGGGNRMWGKSWGGGGGVIGIKFICNNTNQNKLVTQGLFN